MRVYLSTGNTVDDFYKSTFDEVLLVIRGKVDDWRLQRKAAWMIAQCFRGSRDTPDELDFYRLPFDDEIREAQSYQKTKDIEEWHKIASKELTNFRWPTKN